MLLGGTVNTFSIYHTESRLDSYMQEKVERILEPNQVHVLKENVEAHFQKQPNRKRLEPHLMDKIT